MPAVALPIPAGHRLGVGDILSPEENGIQSTPWTHLDDPDFADDLALFSHTQRQMQEKTIMVVDNSARLSLRFHRRKIKNLKNNAAVITTPIILGGDGLEGVTSFTYRYHR